MRATTVVLQIVCVAIGGFFLWFAINSSGRAALGGLMIGSLMFMGASLLGADHITNRNARSRQLFKLLALVFVMPVLLVAGLGLIGSIRRSNWLDAAGALLQVALFLIALLLVVFDHHPLLRRSIARLGLARSTGEVKSK